MDDNPIISAAYRDLGPVLPSPCDEKPRPSSRRVPAETRILISELGLRYRPSAQADLEEHAASLALLAADVADLPPNLLRRAIAEHVRRSNFMPRAAELIALARGYLQREPGGAKVDRDSRENAERLAEQANIRLKGEGKFHIRWVVDEHNALKIEAA